MRHSHVTIPMQTASAMLRVAADAGRIGSVAKFTAISRKQRVRAMAEARRLERNARAIRIELAACQ